MDDADVRLLGALAKDPEAPLAALARAARRSPSATRARLQRLRGRAWQGCVAMPHPHLFGGEAVLAVYAPPRRPLDARALLAGEGVLGYSVNHDGQVAVTYVAAGAAAPAPGRVDALLGGPPARRWVREWPPLQPPGAALSPLEWAVLGALLPDVRASDADLARRLGRDVRTVARHRRRLRDGHRYQPTAVILANLAEGAALFHLHVGGKGTRQPAAIRRQLRWSAVLQRKRDPDGLFLLCHAASLGDALAARDRIARLPGVDHAEIVMEREGALAVERLQAACVARATGGA